MYSVGFHWIGVKGTKVGLGCVIQFVDCVGSCHAVALEGCIGVTGSSCGEVI